MKGKYELLHSYCMITKYDPLGKIKVVPVHVTKALKGIGVNVNLGPRCRLMVNFTPPVA